MGHAWQRLTNGDFVQSDLLWLQHEYAESLIMNGKKWIGEQLTIL